MARPAGSSGKDGTAAAPAARSGPAPRTLTDMPRAGWLAILKRSIREFKHDDITDRAGPAGHRAGSRVRDVMAAASGGMSPGRCPGNRCPGN